MDDDYEDFEEEVDEESSPFLLSFDESGEAQLVKSEDLIQVERKDMELIQGFLDENKESFMAYAKKKGRLN